MRECRWSQVLQLTRGYLDGDATGESATSETFDRLVEMVKSLAGGTLTRCFPIEKSLVLCLCSHASGEEVKISRGGRNGYLKGSQVKCLSGGTLILAPPRDILTSSPDA